MALADEPAPDAMAEDDDDAPADEDTADEEVGAAVGVVAEEDVELQATAPTARLAAMPDTANRRRFFIMSP
jgi:hypothetical protein